MTDEKDNGFFPEKEAENNENKSSTNNAKQAITGTTDEADKKFMEEQVKETNSSSSNEVAQKPEDVFYGNGDLTDSIPGAMGDAEKSTLQAAPEKQNEPEKAEVNQTNEDIDNPQKPEAITEKGLESDNSQEISAEQVINPATTKFQTDQVPEETKPDFVDDGGKFKLPNNAQQNQVYEADISNKFQDLFFIGENQEITIRLNLVEALVKNHLNKEVEKLENPIDCGLNLEINAEEKKVFLKGTPKHSGDLILTVVGTRKDKRSMKISLEITVVADPRTLWIPQEPPADAPYFKAHQDYKRIPEPDDLSAKATLTAARIRGRSHAQRGGFCDDDFAIAYDETWGFVAAVCDGAGSSKYSREASRIISTEMVNNFLKGIKFFKAEDFKPYIQLWDKEKDEKKNQEIQQKLKDWINTMYEGVFKRVLNNSFKNLEAVVFQTPKEEERIARNFYTTLIFFWAFPADERWFLFSYQVGDGAIAVKFEDKFELWHKPDGGEYSGQTRFLTRDLLADTEIFNRCKFKFLKNFQAIWAFTDGIADPKFSSDAALEQSENWIKLEKEFAATLANREELLEALAFWSKGEHDDRTICVLEVKETENTEQKAGEEEENG